jgi:prevent-host-death family protein
MVVTNIATLKASLSELLANVKAGEEVVVTERGRPVARIVPYEPGGDELDDLVRTGRMRRSRSHLPPDFWTRPRPADPGGRLLQALLEERDAAR